MDLIYTNAELTIIATAGKDAESGLPGVSPRHVVQPSARIGKRFLVSSMEDPCMFIRDSTWNKRGWTYQEGLLSRRRLVFTRHQVYFECCGMYCYESLNFPLSTLHTQDLNRFKASFCSGVNLGIFPRQLGRTEWEVVQRIEEYSAKTLTNPSDILNGFSGILRALGQSPRKIQHCKGVPFLPRPPKPTEMGRNRAQEAQEIYNAYKWSPTVGFCAGLCWNASKALERRDGFPSWSWTGWEGAIKWSFREWQWRLLSSTSDVQFKVQLDYGKWCGLDDYFDTCIGAPISDTLLISGLVTPIRLVSGPFYHQRGDRTETEAEARSLTENGTLANWMFTPTAEGLDVQTLGTCLAIELANRLHSSDNRYLVVVAEIERGIYERIGFTELLSWHPMKVPTLAKVWMEFRLK